MLLWVTGSLPAVCDRAAASPGAAPATSAGRASLGISGNWSAPVPRAVPPTGGDAVVFPAIERTFCGTWQTPRPCATTAALTLPSIDASSGAAPHPSAATAAPNAATPVIRLTMAMQASVDSRVPALRFVVNPSFRFRQNRDHFARPCGQARARRIAWALTTITKGLT
jgi:hypothetical protein